MLATVQLVVGLLNFTYTGVPVHKIKFQDKIFVKFYNNFRTFYADKRLKMLCVASI